MKGESSVCGIQDLTGGEGWFLYADVGWYKGHGNVDISVFEGGATQQASVNGNQVFTFLAPPLLSGRKQRLGAEDTDPQCSAERN